MDLRPSTCAFSAAPFSPLASLPFMIMPYSDSAVPRGLRYEPAAAPRLAPRALAAPRRGPGALAAAPACDARCCRGVL